MPVRTTLLAAAVTVLALTGCGGDDPSPEATPTSSTSATTATTTAAAATEPTTSESATGWPATGKYGCSESVPRLIGGSYEYESTLRGYVTLRAGGRYTDPDDVDGSYETRGGLVHFSGGRLDQATGEPIEGEPNRIFVRIPTDSGESHWACGLN